MHHQEVLMTEIQTSRLREFGNEIDEIRLRAESEVGEEDVRYLKKVEGFSRTMEVAGRVLLHFSFGPISFLAGVIALWLHKQLQATEVGHMALHGAWDGLPGCERFQSETFQWDIPIDEEAWRRGHNVRHHQYTNIAGKDPDIHFGMVRLTEHTPHRWKNYLQLPIALFITWPNFTFFMNGHLTGLIDVYFGNGRGGFDFIEDRSANSVMQAHKKALRKYLPYYFKNYLLFPLLAGPGFLKVLFGNWLAETMRDVYSAATIYCGHVGDDTAAYPDGTRAHGRGQWYAMQIEATNNFEVSLPISILCGALDKQIEHHLFPRLPPNRLRQIAPEVRAVCEKYGVRYRSAGWGKTLRGALSRVAHLSLRDVA
jgi:linoleoyl-CoA desaturase